MPTQRRDIVGPVLAHAVAESFPSHEVPRYVSNGWGYGRYVTEQVFNTSRFGANLTQVAAGSIALGQVDTSLRLFAKQWRPYCLSPDGSTPYFSSHEDLEQREEVVEAIKKPGHLIIIGGYLRRTSEHQNRKPARFQLIPYSWDLIV